ncbi:MAG: P27 family phage terminase small subunit [Acidobacteriota bacterium]|nr:P27 family phage terminase small subunit [Acidobacteriota bacterium]
MGRPRKPTEILELNGAFKKDPQRRKGRENEPRPTGPLGDPPESFEKEEKAMWFEISAQIPAGVATNADRISFELMCKIASKVREEGIGGRHGASVGEVAQLNNLLGSFGLKPADRSKISVPKRPEEESIFTKLAKSAGTEGERPN